LTETTKGTAKDANAAVATILQGIFDQQERNHKENGERNASTNARLVGIEEKIATFVKAFPEGDMEGHCAYHKTLIDRARLINEILRDVLKHTAKWGLLGVAGWLAWTAVLAFKAWLQTK
jgi:hypothetical protein